MEKEGKVALVIPSYNATTENNFDLVLKKIYEQRDVIDIIKIYDSESKDNTIDIVKKYNFELEIIKKNDFSHSGTRTEICKDMKKRAVKLLFFLTQDVFLQENSLALMIDYLENNQCAVVYGKQEVDLRRGDIFEYYSRKFNYGEKNQIKSKKDISELGIKTIFSSDAFALYDLNKAEKVGYFGYDVNFSEDMFIADRFIQNDESIGYCADSKVFHTHNYSFFEEYTRYKSIGKFHKQQASILAKYGKIDNKGVQLAFGELKYLADNKKYKLIPTSILRNISKFIGFKIGSR